MKDLPTIETRHERADGTQEDFHTRIIDQYNTMRLKTTKNVQKKFSQVRGNIKNKLVALSAPSHDDIVFNLAILEPKVKQENIGQDYSAPPMKIKLHQVSVVDKINLHKQTREAIFS